MRPYLYHLRTRCAAYLGNPLLLVGGLFLGPLFVVLLDWIALDFRSQGADFPLPWSWLAITYLVLQLLILSQVRGSSTSSAMVLHPGGAACPTLPLHPLGRAFTESLVTFALPFASGALCLLGLDLVAGPAERYVSAMLHQAMLSDLWRLAAAALPFLTGIGLLIYRGAGALRITCAVVAYMVFMCRAEPHGLLAAPLSFAAVGAGWAGLVWLSRPVSSMVERGWLLAVPAPRARSGRVAGPLARPGLPPLTRLRRDALLGAAQALGGAMLSMGFAALCMQTVLHLLHERPVSWDDGFRLTLIMACGIAGLLPFGLLATTEVIGGGGQVGFGPAARAWSILPVPPVQVARLAYIHCLGALLLGATGLCAYIRGISDLQCVDPFGGFLLMIVLMFAAKMATIRFGPVRFARIDSFSGIAVVALSFGVINPGILRLGVVWGRVCLVLLLIPWAIVSLVLPYLVLFPSSARRRG